MDSSPSTSLRETTPADEGWFDRLPEEHRQRILAEDEAYLERWDEVALRGAHAWRKPARQAALLFAFIGAYVTAFSLLPILSCALFGGLCGWVWQRTGAGQVSAPLIAVPLFWLALLVTGSLNVFAVIWAPLPICVVSVWSGLRRGELPGA